MSEFMDLITSRRSIRKFQDRPVPPEALETLYQAVRWAPSWANTQCWEIVNVTDPELRRQLQQTLGKGNPATKAITDAPVLLALAAKLEQAGYYKGQVTTKFGDWFMFDLGLASMNLSLAAHQMGLGSVIVGLFDHDRAARILGVPPGYELVALIPLGYPAQDPKPPKRKEIAEFVHQGRWGGK